MPLTNTIGTAAARSFGFLTSSIIGWVGSIVSSISGRQKTQNVVVTVDSSNNIYSNGNQDSSLGSTVNYYLKLTSAGATSIKYAQSYTSVNGYADSSGNFYDLSSYAYGSYTANYVLKRNSSGVSQFSEVIYISNGNQQCWLTGITSDSSNNLYVSGYTNNGSYYYTLLLKFNSSGTWQWTKALYTYSTSYVEKFYRVATDSSGNIYACGSLGSATYKAALVKYNTSGSVLWQRALAYSGSTVQANCIAISGSNIYIAGWTNYPFGTSIYSLFFAKYDSTGALIFQKYSSSINNYSNPKDLGICVDSSGNIYIAATHETNTSTAYPVISKFDSSGNLSWSKKITSGVTYTYSSSLVVNSLNKIILSVNNGLPSSATGFILTLPSNIQNGIYNGFTFSDSGFSFSNFGATSADPLGYEANYTVTAIYGGTFGAPTTASLNVNIVNV